MFKKHKQLITGFILGALLFGTMPVQAKVQEYLLQKSTAKVVVDGEEFANKELPVMNYKGYNYIPMATFREICNTVGIGFEWAGESREVQIDTGKSVPSKDDQGDDMDKTIENEKYNLLIDNSIEYISFKEIHNRFDGQGYGFGYDGDKNETYFYRNIDAANDINKKTILLENIPIKSFNGLSHIEYSFYKENILPLIN